MRFPFQPKTFWGSYKAYFKWKYLAKLRNLQTYFDKIKMWFILPSYAIVNQLQRLRTFCTQTCDILQPLLNFRKPGIFVVPEPSISTRANLRGCGILGLAHSRALHASQALLNDLLHFTGTYGLMEVGNIGVQVELFYFEGSQTIEGHILVAKPAPEFPLLSRRLPEFSSTDSFVKLIALRGLLE